MPRFLHTADWQIGRAYGQFPAEDAIPLADARIAVVERIAALARERAVDAVLVAGDVFDAQGVADRTLRQLFNALAGFDGPWVMIPGNHDAALAESVWTRARRAGLVPPHVTVHEAPGVQLLPGAALAVLAAPLTQRHTHDDLTAAFDTLATPEPFVRVGLAHGCVQGLLAEGIDSANPIAPDRAARARLDYLALGDWHGCRRVDDRTWYSGTPEPDRFRGNEPGQVLEVTLAGPGAPPDVRRHAVALHRWQDWDETLRVAGDVDALARRLEALAPGDVLRVVLQGTLDLAGRARLDDALARARGRARSVQVDTAALRLAPTDEDIAGLRADGYLGGVLSDLRQRAGAAEAGADVAQEALAWLARLLQHRPGAAPPPGAAAPTPPDAASPTPAGAEVAR